MKFLQAFASPNLSASQAVARALKKIEDELSEIPSRIKLAQAPLGNLSDMTDEEHATVDSDLASLRRKEARLKSQVEKAKEALAQAIKDEAAAALAARRDAANKKHPTYSKLVARYEKEAAALAATVADIAAIEEEVAAVNRDIIKAMREHPDRKHPALVPTPDEVHRVEPDSVEPDRKVIEEKVCRLVQSIELEDHNEAETGRSSPTRVAWERWEPVGVTQTDGNKLILRAGEVLRKFERVIPGRRRPGRRISSPTTELVLPPARVGQPKLWPRQ